MEELEKSSSGNDVKGYVIFLFGVTLLNLEKNCGQTHVCRAGSFSYDKNLLEFIEHYFEDFVGISANL